MRIKYDKILTDVIRELENPTDKLQSIREQLKSGYDIHGLPLVTVTVNLDTQVIKELDKFADNYNATPEEIIWLFLDGVIQPDSVTE